MYDYVPSKVDWFACGMPREGQAADVPWAGDLVREATTCAPDETVGDVAERVRDSDHDFCVVVFDEERIVLGLLRGDALAKDPEANAEDVMELGPKTISPSKPVEELLASRSAVGVKSWIVTTSHGAFLGVLDRDDAERALPDEQPS